MTLAEALTVIRSQTEATRKRKLLLACGFESLHLATFFRGHFGNRFPGEAVDLRTGLYGDLEGTLSGAAASECEGAAVVIEWSDLDSRLGLRSAGGWGISVQDDIVRGCRDRFRRLVGSLGSVAAAMPVVLVPPTLPVLFFGHTARRESGFSELELERLLGEFLADAARLPRVSVLSRARLDGLSPVAARLDPAMELKAGFPYSLGHASVLAGQMVELLFPPGPMKGLITDLDDTLWSGIVGEVGVAGVGWSLADHAQIHGLYQQLLRQFSEMGVLLAIASKNESAVVQEALQRPDLYVPATAFYPVRADWGAKSRHIEEILRVWNIGADGVVFIDDSPMELDEVRTAFPSITCLRFEKKHPAKVVALFGQLRDLFGKHAVQKEDTLRQSSIRAREAFDTPAASSDDFLRGLQGRVTFDVRKDASNQRVLELINKTNQFNLNGVRLTEGEWLRHLADPDSFVAGVSYDDKFGPLGMIGVVAGKRTGDHLEISTWVLSCRAFSRRIEHHTLAHLFQSSGAKSVSLAFVATQRNQPLQEFLKAMLPEGGGSGWSLSKDAFDRGKQELPHGVAVSG